MPIERVQLAENERAISADANAFGTTGIANLALAMRAFVAPVLGDVARGFRVRQTTSPSADVVVEPGGAVDASGDLIILEEDEQLTVSTSHATLDRTDIVQAKVDTAQDAVTQSRKVWDPGANDWTDQNIPTRSRDLITVAIKAGTAGGGVPTPDAGYLKIAEIFVAAGGGAPTITDADINLTTTSKSLRVATFQGDGATHGPLPYTTGTLFTHTTPEGFNTILVADLTAMATYGGTIAYGASPNLPIWAEIIDAGSAAVVGRALWMPGGTILTGEQMLIVGSVAGPTAGARNYALKFDTVKLGAGPHTGSWADSIKLPTSITDTDRGTVQLYNHIYAVTF